MKNENTAVCKRPNRTSQVIRIDLDLVEEINRLAEVTRTPAKVIASDAIRFALKHAVMKPVECCDVEFVVQSAPDKERER